MPNDYRLSGRPRRDATRGPQCALDMQRYPPGDRKFVLGALTLLTCPTSPAKARDYVDALLSARRDLHKDGPPGIQVGDQPARRKRSLAKN